MNALAPYPTVTLWPCDVFEALSWIPDNTFDCIVTSPPYWRLRDYGVTGQIGLEPTMREYLTTVIRVCRELRRVLKPGGTFWLNVGDSYAGSWGAQSRGGPPSVSSTLLGNGHVGGGPKLKSLSRVQIEAHPKGQRQTGTIRDIGLKPKDLMMIPNRMAILLQEDGWYVRSEIIWHKPNPMPESVKDRPTNAHEKIWLLTNSPKYFYNAGAIRNPPSPSFLKEVAEGYAGVATKDFSVGGAQQASATKTRIIEKARERIDKQRGHSRRHAGFNDRWDTLTKDEQQALGSNARNVWTISPSPFKGAHFATFPPELVTRCISAGCPASGSVLDPFGGSGTTGVVALTLGRSATLIEINPDYCAMIRQRTGAL